MGRPTDMRHDDPRTMHSLEFRLPDLGEGLTEAEIVQWLVEVGDYVTVDQPVVEVETAKAMVEVPCPYGGVVTARFGEQGTELPVGAPLLTVAVGSAAPDGPQASEPPEATAAPDGTGEAPSAADGPSRGDTEAGDRAEAAAGHGSGSGPASGGGEGTGGASERRGAATDEGSGNVLVGYGTAGAPARRRRVLPPSVPENSVAHTAGDTAATTAVDGARGGGGRGDADTPGLSRRAGRTEGPVPVISPLVRKMARDHGLDLRKLSGSGPDGLITRADVEYAVRAASHTQAAPGTPAQEAPAQEAPAQEVPAQEAPVPAGANAAAPSVTSSGPAPSVPSSGSASSSTPADSRTPVPGLRTPLRGVRGAVAEKMARSRREIPDATCWVDADATELLAARAVMNAAGGPKISVLALLARICTAALARHPELNATIDTAAREIVRLEAVHLGFAAQTERGLVVPVVRDAQARDAESLSDEFARLTGAARAGTLTPGELTGGTFTLNNYGVFGVDGSTPIINHPEAAMLGVGRISPKPWVREGELAVRQVVQLSLTFDHRVCDGGTAGGFLRYVADCVEQPAILLRTL